MKSGLRLNDALCFKRRREPESQLESHPLCLIQWHPGDRCWWQNLVASRHDFLPIVYLANGGGEWEG